MAEIIDLPRAVRGRGMPPCAYGQPTVPTAEDPHTRMLPAITGLFADHVKARADVRRKPSRARAVKAENAFAEVVEMAEMAVRAPAPRTLAGLGALAAAIAMANEGALDEDGEDSHAELASLIRGVLAVTGIDLPGHEGLSWPD